MSRAHGNYSTPHIYLCRPSTNNETDYSLISYLTTLNPLFSYSTLLLFNFYHSPSCQQPPSFHRPLVAHFSLNPPPSALSRSLTSTHPTPSPPLPLPNSLPRPLLTTSPLFAQKHMTLPPCLHFVDGSEHVFTVHQSTELANRALHSPSREDRSR